MALQASNRRQRGMLQLIKQHICLTVLPPSSHRPDGTNLTPWWTELTLLYVVLAQESRGARVPLVWSNPAARQRQSTWSFGRSFALQLQSRSNVTRPPPLPQKTSLHPLEKKLVHRKLTVIVWPWWFTRRRKRIWCRQRLTLKRQSNCRQLTARWPSPQQADIRRLWY